MAITTNALRLKLGLEWSFDLIAWQTSGMRVWYPGPRDDIALRQLSEMVSSFATVSLSEPMECDVLIEGRPTVRQLERVKNGGFVIVPYVGIAYPTTEALRTRPDLSLHNLHHNDVETAETAMALLLAASRRLVTGDASMRRGDWKPRYTPEECIRLDGRTALVLGLGHIGQRIARACQGLGIEVIGMRRHAGESELPFPVFPVSELSHQLPRANFLILALPQTPETEGLVGAKELAALRKPSILVNIARAQIVQEEALYESLRDGTLLAAGLDVWYRYPKHPEGMVPGYFDMPAEARATFPSQYPFQELANVVMSPHRGGSSADSEMSRLCHLSAMLEDLRATGEMKNRVDLDSGY